MLKKVTKLVPDQGITVTICILSSDFKDSFIHIISKRTKTSGMKNEFFFFCATAGKCFQKCKKKKKVFFLSWNQNQANSSWHNHIWNLPRWLILSQSMTSKKNDFKPSSKPIFLSLWRNLSTRTKTVVSRWLTQTHILQLDAPINVYRLIKHTLLLYIQSYSPFRAPGCFFFMRYVLWRVYVTTGLQFCCLISDHLNNFLPRYLQRKVMCCCSQLKSS